MLQANAPNALTINRTVRGMRPLLLSGEKLYCCNGHRIYVTRDDGLTFKLVCTLSVPSMCKASRPFSFARRLLRTDTHRMCELSGGNRVYVYRGGIYIQRFNQATATCTFSVTRGSRPVAIASSPVGDVVFGEYWNNRSREEVHIFGSSDGGLTWDPVYTFPAGAIRHVHGVFYDRFDDCYWICTGDYGNENQLLRASVDFSDVQIVRQGGQQNRFFSIQVFEDSLVAATDTPSEQNHILIIDKETGEAKPVLPVDNSVFYTTMSGGRIVVSTNAERSAVNDDRHSHLWISDRSLNRWDRIFSRPTDIVDRLSRMPKIRSGMTQHPHFIFPAGESDRETIACYGLGLRGLNDSLVFFDTRQLQEKSYDLSKAA